MLTLDINSNTSNICINNKVDAIGIINSELEYSHEVYGEKFFSFIIKIKRLSAEFDYLSCIISERIIDLSKLKIEKLVNISGQYRSYNNITSSGNKLILAIFVKNITVLHRTNDKDINNIKNLQDNIYVNSILLNGHICKQPTYRSTPLGRDITDVLLAVNRNYNKSDYIPCIAWGRNAKFAGSLTVGTNITIIGRIQSRQYKKYLTESEAIYKTAYEVSISKLEVVRPLRSL